MTHSRRRSFWDGQLIGLREKLQENPWNFMGKSMVSCRSSLQLIHWDGQSPHPLWNSSSPKVSPGARDNVCEHRFVTGGPTKINTPWHGIYVCKLWPYGCDLYGLPYELLPYDYDLLGKWWLIPGKFITTVPQTQGASSTFARLRSTLQGITCDPTRIKALVRSTEK